MHEQLAAHADRRVCPKCGHLGMAAATRCGYCWTKLTPLVPGSEGTKVGPALMVEEAAPVDEGLRRDCPVCGRRIMLAATQCGFCWTRLASGARSGADAAQAAPGSAAL